MNNTLRLSARPLHRALRGVASPWMSAESPRFAIPKMLSGRLVNLHPKFLSYSFRTTEPHVFSWMRKHLKSGAVALDIGANFGFLSLFMAKCVGVTGSVYAFEPSPANVALLKYHREHNAGLKINIVEAAVSNQHRGSVRFFLLDEGLHSSNSLTFGRPEVPNLDPALHANQTEIVVETVSIDGFCADSKLVPNLIKIDVEGAEILVLEGCRQTLSHARPVLILAVHPWWLPDGRTVADIQRLLADSGYIATNEQGQQVEDLPYGEYLCLPSPLAARRLG